MDPHRALITTVVAVSVLMGGCSAIGGGGGDSASTTAPAPETPAPTPTPTATPTATPSRTPTQTAVPETTRTSTPTETATVSPTPTEGTAAPTPRPASDLNRTALERGVESEINSYRDGEGLRELTVTGETARTLDELTRNHSQRLLEAGEAWRVPTEYDLAGLYRHYDLYRQCQFKQGEDESIRPGNGRLVSVLEVNVSSGDEAATAETVFDEWQSSTYHGEEFDYRNAEYLDVGVVVDRQNETAYVTSAVC